MNNFNVSKRSLNWLVTVFIFFFWDSISMCNLNFIISLPLSCCIIYNYIFKKKFVDLHFLKRYPPYYKLIMHNTIAFLFFYKRD